MNTATLATNFDTLTLDQLDTASGGSFWSAVVHDAKAVGHSVKVAGDYALNAAKYGAATGGAIGFVAGAEGGPPLSGAAAGAGAGIGGVLGGVAGFSYGIGHEIGTHLRK